MKIIGCIFLSMCVLVGSANAEEPPVRIGWLGAMSGAVAKYGAYQAAILAADDVNSSGGIRGRKLELVFQDGKCNSRDAITAVQHLLGVEQLRFIVGGHCSPESLPIAPLVEKAKAVMLAAITSSPKLSTLGDFVFRVTAPNIDGVKLLNQFIQKRGFKRAAIVFEETEYAQGLAEFFKSHAEAQGLEVVRYDGFAPGETDFRSLVTRLRASGAEVLYLSPQSPDATVLFLRALHEQSVKLTVLGNEIAGNTVKAAGPSAALFDEMIFAEPEFNSESAAVKDFEARYKSRFGVTSLPYGFYTCEAYDAVRVMAHVIARCGEEPEEVKRCLYALQGYQGLSGEIAFDENGDAKRTYVLKRIQGGEIRLGQEPVLP